MQKQFPEWVPVAVRRRGGLPETVHYGAVAAADPEGRLLFSVGDPQAETFFRSSVKPFQALPMVKSGAPERFGFSIAELALSCASHNGEPFHAATAASMLKKIGLGVEHLRCGAHPPYNKEAARELVARGEKYTALHSNCSGKHASMLAACLMNDWPLDTYLAAGHPLQQAIRLEVAAAAGREPDSIPAAIDGCGVPTFYLPVAQMARVFARLAAAPSETPLRRLGDAMAAHPEMVDGTGDFDTRLMQVTKGRLLCKRGGAALGCVARRDPASGKGGYAGLAVKCGDGTSDIVPLMLMRALEKMNWLTAEEIAALAEFRAPPQRNVAGLEVGVLEAIF